MSEENFDFSGYPKLGRPFVAGSPRNKYLKFYFSIDELKMFEMLEKNVKKFYDLRGYSYNRPAHMRLFFTNFDNPHVLHFLFENLTPELKNHYVKDSQGAGEHPQ
jgi:hypothetical protein